MEYTPDYSTYSYSDLVDAFNNIDHDKYPERAAELQNRIANYKPSSNVVEENVVNPDHIDQLEFKGNTKEFFSIWIVNILLTIVTLGVYSAWAKVRTNTYFYGNSFLDESSFRYHAKPLQILKGRVIAVVLFLAYYTSGFLSPEIAGVTIGIIALLMPAFIVMSLAFRMRNSSYRNVFFDFDKDFKGAYLIFLAPFILFGFYTFTILQMQSTVSQADDVNTSSFMMLAILPFVIILLYPVFEYFLLQFRVVKSAFGTESFNFKSKISSLYGIYVPAAIALFIGVIIATVFMGMIIGVLGRMFGDGDGDVPVFVSFLITIPMATLYLLFFAYIQTKRTNLVYNATSIGNHKLSCELSVNKMFELYFSNTLGIAFSLGLLVPWAMIRTTRYKLSCMSLISEDNIKEFVAAQRNDQTAYGEEVGEMFDIDIGI